VKRGGNAVAIIDEATIICVDCEGTIIEIRGQILKCTDSDGPTGKRIPPGPRFGAPRAAIF
jgi:hypothetical protein